MHWTDALKALKAAGRFAEIETEGRNIFIKTECARGRLTFIQIKNGAVSSSSVNAALATA